jgi:hypothetical protein
MVQEDRGWQKEPAPVLLSRVVTAQPVLAQSFAVIFPEAPKAF